MKPTTKRRCTQLTKTGNYCRAWALRDSDPPTCAMHAGRVTGQGAPQGNRNAVKHGLYAVGKDCRIDLDGIERPPINGIIQAMTSTETLIAACRW